MQLKRQNEIEAWQNEKHYSKGNNTSENTILKTSNIQISRPCEVRRSGQLTTLVVCVLFSWSFQAAVLRTKTAINRRGFLILSEMSGSMD